MRTPLSSAVVIALLTTLTGCSLDKLSKHMKEEADKAIADEAKKAVASSTVDSAKKSDDASDGPMWKETVTGETKKMAMTSLAAGDLAGYSLFAPEGAKVKKSLGGKGTDVDEDAYGYHVWVHEDPTATPALMKSAIGGLYPGSKLEDEQPTSFVVNAKGLDGSPAYYFYGLYKIDGKNIVCQTPSSISPGEKEHATQIGKACASLKSDSGKVADAASAAPVAPSTGDTQPTSAHASPTTTHASAKSDTSKTASKPADPKSGSTAPKPATDKPKAPATPAKTGK